MSESKPVIVNESFDGELIDVLEEWVEQPRELICPHCFEFYAEGDVCPVCERDDADFPNR